MSHCWTQTEFNVEKRSSGTDDEEDDDYDYDYNVGGMVWYGMVCVG